MSAPLLQADAVSVRIGQATIVSAVTLSLARGELVALVGPNGAGKTTLMRALAGLIGSHGEIAIDGTPLASLDARARARRIAYLPQGNAFHWPMPVADIVALGRYPHGDPFGRIADADRRATLDALSATETESLAHRPVTTLSGGERARVALARALATQAPLLLADEPTVSLDVRHQLVVMQLLRNAAQAGGGVLAILHDLALAARFADRVLVMQAGRLAAQGRPAEILVSPAAGEVFGVELAAVESGEGLVPFARRPR